MKTRLIFTVFLLNFSFCVVISEYNEYAVDKSALTSRDVKFEFIPDKHDRRRRDVSAPTNAVTTQNTSSVPTTASSTSVVSPTPPVNNSDDSNRTTHDAQNATTALSTVEIKQPLLGVNGSGILHVNVTTNTPKVSDPILPNDDNITDVFKETPEMIKAALNISDINYDNHDFYNSSFIGNLTYFQEYWKNITQHKAEVHEILSNSHRRATSLKLSFEFPFYGHGVNNITVATGGFIYTGDLVHNWLAATQYIAPLMANFDTRMTNDSVIKMYDDGEKFTVFWENATLQEAPDKKFTFAVTLYKNGDIVFAYKDIPIPVQAVNDKEHPVKVGISDAYLKDKILFYVRRKTIYEYHRVSFKNHNITSNTILRLTALPTCLQYDSCTSCVNHETGFDCMWCEQIQKCSSGTDRNKQDWLLRNCDRFSILNETSCPATAHVDAPSDNGNTAYTTDVRHPDNTIVNTLQTEETKKSNVSVSASSVSRKEIYTSSHIGGVVAAFVTITLICSLAAWILYAFKNPHTRSGQLLIKYRPSQWGWRRGEARYTAATIHM